MEDKLGQEPAYPSSGFNRIEYNEYPFINLGMSKRFYAACAAMQGLLANNQTSYFENGSKTIVEKSFQIADELLKQENE